MKTTNVLIISFALIVSAATIACGMSKIAKNSRTVSVRGLAEREVPADMATWRVSFSVSGNDLAALQREVISKTKIVLDFLGEYDLDEGDYSVLSPEITDTTTNIYLDQSRRQFNYVAKQTVLVRTEKVSSAKAASIDTIDLMGKGVALSSDYDNRVRYEFNGLNEIKPEMIADATKNALLAAEQFAHDSGSKVGKIVSANQGLFSIEDAAVGLEDIKNVRVVTTVVYSLKD
ncbi:MAG: SIMPL domain-containing protein [Treponema sp.]|nr:SIMPL domain-containing protein [Treponema sp.]